MKCHKCGIDLPDDAFYCYVCGSKVKPESCEEDSSEAKSQTGQNTSTSIEKEDMSNVDSSIEIEGHTCDDTSSKKVYDSNNDSPFQKDQSSGNSPELKAKKSSTIYWIAGVFLVILIIKGCNAVLVHNNQKRLMNYVEKEYGSIQSRTFFDTNEYHYSKKVGLDRRRKCEVPDQSSIKLEPFDSRETSSARTTTVRKDLLKKTHYCPLKNPNRSLKLLKYS